MTNLLTFGDNTDYFTAKLITDRRQQQMTRLHKLFKLKHIESHYPVDTHTQRRKTY